MLIETTLISFLGAILCLDRICLQIMISRPIVAAPLIGLILGDIKTGLVGGAFLELLWVDRPALGNYIPPNDSLLAVFITASIILAGHELASVSPALIIFSILLFIPFSYITQKMDAQITKSNDKLSDDALEDARRSSIKDIEKRHLAAVLKTFVIDFIFIFVCTIFGTNILVLLYPKLQIPTIQALNIIYFSFPVFILAIALNSIKLKRDIPVFIAIFISALMILEYIHVL